MCLSGRIRETVRVHVYTGFTVSGTQECQVCPNESDGMHTPSTGVVRVYGRVGLGVCMYTYPGTLVSM